MSPTSKAQQKAVAKYMKNNYDELKIRISKGSKEIIKKAAENSKTNSINGYVTAAINEKLIKDGFEPINKKSAENKD